MNRCSVASRLLGVDLSKVPRLLNVKIPAEKRNRRHLELPKATRVLDCSSGSETEGTVVNGPPQERGCRRRAVPWQSGTDGLLTMGSAIYFYHQDRPYGFFSNFSPHPIRLRGREWPTSEHFFQAQKFEGQPYEEEIRLARTPGLAARLGRSRAVPLRSDWEGVKDDVMREALRAKFTQHEDLRVHLLVTGTAKLVEHTRLDSYWGDGGDGTGRNILGRLLMELRDELRRSARA